MLDILHIELVCHIVHLCEARKAGLLLLIEEASGSGFPFLGVFLL
jgi:hypothetical protein